MMLHVDRIPFAGDDVPLACRPATYVLLYSRNEVHHAHFDLEDWELLKPYTWSLHRCGKGKLYARALRNPHTKEVEPVYMHRLIANQHLGPPPTAKHVVDHDDGDGLNNRRLNLSWQTGAHNRWRTARWCGVTL